MRLTPVTRVLVPPALCAALVFAAAGPAAALTSVPEPVRAAAVANSAIPGAEELSRRVAALHNTPGVPAPVLDLLDDVLKAPGGRLTFGEALGHRIKVRVALATMPRAAHRSAAAADPVSDLLRSVDDLISAALAGLTVLVGSLVDVVTDLLDTVLWTVLDVVGGLLPLPPLLPAETPDVPTDTVLPAAQALTATSLVPAMPLFPIMDTFAMAPELPGEMPEVPGAAMMPAMTAMP